MTEGLKCRICGDGPDDHPFICACGRGRGSLTMLCEDCYPDDRAKLIDDLRAEVARLEAARVTLVERHGKAERELHQAIARLTAENAELRHDLVCAVAEQEAIVRESNAHIEKMTALHELAKRLIETKVDIDNARRFDPSALPAGTHPTDNSRGTDITPQYDGSEGSDDADHCRCGAELRSRGPVKLECPKCGARYERRPGDPEWPVVEVER